MLKKDLLQLRNELSQALGYISFCAINHVIDKQINHKQKEWKRTHELKLNKLFDEIAQSNATPNRIRNTVSNYSSYTLTAEEEHILSFGLDHHIETKINANVVKTEFETMYHHLDKHFKDLSAHEKDTMKSKIRRTCENYTNIPAKSKYEEKFCEKKY